MIISKIQNEKKIYLKMFQGNGSIWTSEKEKAKKFKSREAAKKIAETHRGKVEPNK